MLPEEAFWTGPLDRAVQSLNSRFRCAGGGGERPFLLEKKRNPFLRRSPGIISLPLRLSLSSYHAIHESVQWLEVFRVCDAIFSCWILMLIFLFDLILCIPWSKAFLFTVWYTSRFMSMILVMESILFLILIQTFFFSFRIKSALDLDTRWG